MRSLVEEISRDRLARTALLLAALAAALLVRAAALGTSPLIAGPRPGCLVPAVDLNPKTWQDC